MKNKKIMILVASILGVLLVVGTTYAWLTLTVTGTKTNVIKAGSLELTLDDAASDGINLLEAVPVLDEVGKTTKGYTFTLKNNGTVTSGYTVYLDDVAVGVDETKVSNINWIRYEWVGTETQTSDLEAAQDETNPLARVLETGTISAGETKTYTLKLWISEEATNEIMGQIYRGKIRIEAVQAADRSESTVDTSGAAAPELDEGMIPVVYDETGKKWVKADVASAWYNYDNQMWANAVTVTSTNRATLLSSDPGTEIPMTDINTMWVWVPRYQYTIGNDYGTKLYGGNTPSMETPGAVDIKFVSKDSPLENGSAQYTGTTPANWYTHPAFCFGTLTTINNRTTCDGDEINGVWVAKFEPGTPEGDACATATSNTNCNKSNITPISKPNISSWRFVNIANAFMAVKNNMNGTNGKTIYGLNATSGDSHLIKNMEWGAIAFLSQSKYGKYGNSMYTGVNKEVYFNNYIQELAQGEDMKTLTGCSAGAPSTSWGVMTCAYTYDQVENRGNGTGSGGAGASTTGTIYGIYDMNGAGEERIMGNHNGIVGYDNDSTSGFAGPLAMGGNATGFPLPESKYYDKHVFRYQDEIIGQKGDATIELKPHPLSFRKWYNDDTFFFDGSVSQWFRRGGMWTSKGQAGVFNYMVDSGNAYSSGSFRFVRVPLS